MESNCITPEKTLDVTESYCFKTNKNAIQDLKRKNTFSKK